MRQAARVDENQPDIVEALRKVGATVYIVGRPLDLLVGFRKKNWLLEVKDPDKPKADRQLTPFQKTFFDTWRGQRDKVETSEQAIKIITEQT